MTLTLVPHPQSAALPIDVSVDVARDGTTLSLRYCLSGELDALSMPPVSRPVRADNLWKHSCFEAFLRNKNEPFYLEFNLSPSRHWAAYAFDSYRTGMRNADVVTPIIRTIRSRPFVLGATLNLPGQFHGPLDVGLSAVIEGQDGSMAWYALAHPPGAPDFHHTDCFALELPSLGSA